MILHELLTLEQPFDVDTREALAQLERSRRPLHPSSSNPLVPPALDRLVLWLTDLSPSRRAQTAAAVRTMLEGILEKLPRCDLQGLVTRLFGEELRTERTGIERMVLLAHGRSGAPSAPPREGLFRHGRTLAIASVGLQEDAWTPRGGRGEVDSSPWRTCTARAPS